MNLPKSTRVQKQSKVFKKTVDGHKIGEGALDVTVTVRWDDCCGNGRNSFAVTADVYKAGRPKTDRTFVMGGCCHDLVEEHFPEVAHLIKWHLVDAEGPMHYVANTTYHASEIRKQQHFVYLTDEVLKGKKVLLGLFSDNELQAVRDRFSDFDLEIKSEPTPDSKEANLEAARNCAVWPDATLEDLRDEDKLKARLPALMEEFKRDVEALGFTY